MVNLIRSIHDKLERYLRMQMSLSEGKQRADQEHREIIAACRAGDADHAAALIAEHINGVCQTLHAHLPNRLTPG
jgi:DNA-binding GntR family transcriptional regulator